MERVTEGQWITLSRARSVSAGIFRDHTSTNFVQRGNPSSASSESMWLSFENYKYSGTSGAKSTLAELKFMEFNSFSGLDFWAMVCAR